MVLKLDIDVAYLEDKIIKALVELDMLPMIAEMYYEDHYDAPELRKTAAPNRPGGNPWVVPWPKSISMFHQLRQQGLRIHYWP